VSRALAERLIADAGASQDQLPLIQHGLMLLYRNHTDAPAWRLTLDHYRNPDRLSGMLSDHADAVMRKAQETVAPGNERLVV
jgi:hypothetical protein